MNIALWVIQAILGLFFLFAGGMKLFAFEKFKAQAAERSKGKDLGFSKGFIHFIGACEVAGGFGLIFPTALRIAPALTPLAAFGLAVIMLGATVFHLRRKEPAAFTAILLVLLVVVATGRPWIWS